jgi:probable phosphoglycerate mutase
MPDVLPEHEVRTSEPEHGPDQPAQADPASLVRRWSVPNTEPALVLIRHGETEWSRSGQHTGSTDIALTEVGEQQARAAGPLIRGVLGATKPALVLSSPRQRARRTAELAGFEVDEISDDAAEWDYGDLEGLTSPEIRKRWPDWSVWSGPVPGGEDAEAVTARFDRLLARIAERYETEQLSGPVLVFSHGHAIRCLAARWLGDPVSCGRRFWLGTGAVSSLGYEHGGPVVLRWNVDATVSAGSDG